jgi:hypothetical protein
MTAAKDSIKINRVAIILSSFLSHRVVEAHHRNSRDIMDQEAENYSTPCTLRN